MEMPRLDGCISFMRLPSIIRSPEVMLSRPAMDLNSVDFPQPEGPTKTTNSPGWISRSMPWSTSIFAYSLRIFFSATATMFQLHHFQACLLNASWRKACQVSNQGVRPAIDDLGIILRPDRTANELGSGVANRLGRKFRATADPDEAAAAPAILAPQHQTGHDMAGNGCLRDASAVEPDGIEDVGMVLQVVEYG